MAMKTLPPSQGDADISKAPGEPGINSAEEALPTSEMSKKSLKEYLYSILYMPHSMRMVCLTNLFCWMAHVCYSLYFTDFVGEAVYGGNPKASVNDLAKHKS